MKILTICGSSGKASSNKQFLKLLPTILLEHEFKHIENLPDFPLFTTEKNQDPPANILFYKEEIKSADLVIISTPEYLHNIPAVLKNVFEWVSSSGEFYEKKVLAITYTPHPPRGENAMQSMVKSLLALKASIVAELTLFQTELKITKENQLKGEESILAIKSVFDFLV